MKTMWGTQVPIWVSRETSDGAISQMSVGLWLFCIIWLLIGLNFFCWSIYSLVEFIKLAS